jgi:hypothetical protein
LAALVYTLLNASEGLKGGLAGCCVRVAAGWLFGAGGRLKERLGLLLPA